MSSEPPFDITDTSGGASRSYYLLDISIDSGITLETGEEVVLLPGMTATVDVVSGKRTVLDYIWEPVSKVKELALRD